MLKKVGWASFSIILFLLIAPSIWAQGPGQGAQVTAPTETATDKEIRRGAGAAFGCYEEFPPDLIVKEKTDCMEQLLKESEAKKISTDPYLLGLYFRAWTLLSTDLKSFEPMYSMMERKAELDIIKKRVATYFQRYKGLQSKLLVDDKALCGLLKLNYDATKKDIDAWSSKKE